MPAIPPMKVSRQAVPRFVAVVALVVSLFCSHAIGQQPDIAPPPPKNPRPQPQPLPRPRLPFPSQPFDQAPGGNSDADRIMQQQLQLGPGGIQIGPGGSLNVDPAGRSPIADPSKLSASAVFEPGVIGMKRFGDYRVTINGARNGIELPDVLPVPEGLVVNDAGRSYGVQIVNGQRVENVTYRYSVTAIKPGTYVLPSFTVQVAGVGVTVPAAQVVVNEPQPGEELYQSARAVIDLQPGEYFVGQNITTRLLLIDSNDELAQAIANVTKPSGDFLFKSQLGARRETFEFQGKKVSGLAMPIQLTPIKAGESEVSLQAIVFVNRITDSTGLSRPRGSIGGFTSQAMLDTPPVRVLVRPLPDAGRRRGFTGAIGKFDLGQPQVSANEVEVGDPLTLTIMISGMGNLEAISPPLLEGGDAWQTFSPTSDVDRDVLTGRGTKTFTYTLIAKNAEARAVPAVPFSYFDPEKKEYVDLTVPPVAVTVKGAPASPPAPENAAAASAPEPEKPKVNEPILTGLAETPASWRRDVLPAAAHGWFWILQAVPALILATLWLRRRRADFLVAHPEVIRRRRARQAVRRHLSRARSAARARKPEEFVAAGVDAIREAAAPLDTAQAQSLVLEEVLSKFDESERSGEPGRIVRKFFETAHTARFSGHAPEPNGVTELLPELTRTVASLSARKS